VDLDAEHRNTLEQIFARPSSGNVEWRRVRSLHDEVATVTERHNGKLRVRLGGGTEVLERPRGKDVDAQMLVDLRRMLTRAGIAPRHGARVGSSTPI
jgi:CO/xanthine dehydrogenase FAD-binding subunit